jgi:NTE family protein
MSLLDNAEQFEQIARDLRGTSIFRLTSRYDLARLLTTATLKSAKAGEDICVPDNAQDAAPSSSFFIILSGSFHLHGETQLGGSRNVLAGVEDVVRGKPRSITLKATSNGTYVEVQASALLSLLQTSTPLRQSLHPLLNLTKGGSEYVSPIDGHGRGNIIQLETTILDAPLSLLIELLAREIAKDFADHVLVLRSCPRGQTSSPAPIQVQGNGLGELWYAYVDPGTAPDIVKQYWDHYDYIFLDGVSSVVVDTVVKLFFGYPEGYVAAPLPGNQRVLQTIVIGQPPLPCSNELYFVNANQTRTSHASDCRIRLDLVKVRALAQAWNPYAPYGPIDESLDHEMGVWARALTQRRTGIALAGGGVWSMQSVYIIRELIGRGVPLDIITGASAGAMVGGYYGAFGLPGLDLLLERADSGVLDLVVGLWIFNGCFAQTFFDMEFGAHTCLDNLHVDFRPNATNLTIGEGVAFVRGPLASAVRAAGSAPPLLPPTFSGDQRFADGAFSNNLAAQILPYFGADLTFGANTYPPSRRPKPAWVPNIFTRITSVGPLNRMMDFTVALNLLSSLTGRVEGGYADVAYNATTDKAFPFLKTSDFCLASKMVQSASEDPMLHAKIDEFVRLWEHSRRRGGRAWTTTPV